MTRQRRKMRWLCLCCRREIRPWWYRRDPDPWFCSHCYSTRVIPVFYRGPYRLRIIKEDC